MTRGPRDNVPHDSVTPECLPKEQSKLRGYPLHRTNPALDYRSVGRTLPASLSLPAKFRAGVCYSSLLMLARRGAFPQAVKKWELRVTGT